MSHQSDHDSDDDDDCYGPQLPPDFSSSSNISAPSTSRNEQESIIEVIGPLLPPGFRRRSSSSSSDGDEDGLDTCYNVRGPVLNPGMSNEQEVEDEEDEDDGDVIGPVVPSSANDLIDRKRGYLDPSYHASQSMGRSGNDDGKDMKREEWMTVVPKKVIKKMGFKSVTSFCRKPADNDDDDHDGDGDDHDGDQGKVESRLCDPSSSTSKMSIEKEEKIRQAYEEYSQNKRSLIDQHRESMSKVCTHFLCVY